MNVTILDNEIECFTQSQLVDNQRALDFVQDRWDLQFYS